MAYQRFQLVFVGSACEAEQLETVKAAIADRFKLDQRKVDLLFSTKPVVVKKDLDAETAITYKQVIDRLGGLARIEAMPLNSDTVRESWFIERRLSRRRFQRERRKSARVWMYRSDRRRNSGRRACDGN